MLKWYTFALGDNKISLVVFILVFVFIINLSSFANSFFSFLECMCICVFLLLFTRNSNDKIWKCIFHRIFLEKIKSKWNRSKWVPSLAAHVLCCLYGIEARIDYICITIGYFIIRQELWLKFFIKPTKKLFTL